MVLQDGLEDSVTVNNEEKAGEKRFSLLKHPFSSIYP